MILQEYITNMDAAFRRNTREGVADCPRLLKDVCRELNKARRELTQEKRYKDLMELTSYTYNKWSDTPRDDSNGESSEFCNLAFEVFETIYEEGEEEPDYVRDCEAGEPTKSATEPGQQIEAAVQQEISHLDMLTKMEMMVSGVFLNFFEIEIMSFVLEHFKTPQELSQKEAFFREKIDEIKKLPVHETALFHSRLYSAQERLVRVLADQKKPIEEIREILRGQNNIAGLKSLADIEKEYGNYEEAIALYKEVLEEEPDFYFADEIKMALMEIYEFGGSYAEYKQELFRQMLAHPGEESCYQKYKASVTEEEWEETWEEITKKYKGHYDEIVRWLRLENRYDLVMEAAEPDKGYILDWYEKELFGLYPERCLKVMEKYLENIAELVNKRSSYKMLAWKISALGAYPGGREVSRDLARRLCAKYPRRRAMLEELKYIV